MKQIEQEVHIMDKKHFHTLTIKFSSGSKSAASLSLINSLIKNTLKEYAITEERLIDITSSWDRNNGSLIKIEYCDFDLLSICSLEIKDRILSLLDNFGYNKEFVKSVTYENYYSNFNQSINQLRWVVRLSGHYNLDNTYSQLFEEKELTDLIEKFLGIKVVVSH